MWVITPKAFNALTAAAWPAPSAAINIYDGLCFEYLYDEYGKVTDKRVPGKGITSIVYDSKHRPVLTRDPAQQDKGEWSFVVYDNRNRAVFTGTTNSTRDRQGWQSIINGTNAPAPGTIESYLYNDFDGAYPNSISSSQINSYNYYDSYTFDPTFPFSRSFYTGHAAKYGTSSVNVRPEPFYFVNGRLTATRTRVLNPVSGILNEWISSVYYYDQKGHSIQVQTLNPHSTSNWDITTSQYNFDGTLNCVITDHYNDLGGQKPHTQTTLKNTYAVAAGRLQSTKLQIDNNPEVLLASYFYDDLGRLKNKNIGNGVEKQTYTYNIRGQLTGINPGYISNPSYPDATFGCQLYYDYGFDSYRFDGSIAGMIWRGAGSLSNPRACGYNYDKAGRLVSADFNEYPTGSIISGTWNKTDHDYSVDNITYDANGNMLSMHQRGTGANGPMDLDNLSYTYNPNSNTLSRVEDTEPDHGMNDFVNRNAGTPDYDYDKNGNLKSDLNKGITAINYNNLDLPTEVNTQSNGSIKNVYDAAGNLVEKVISPSSGPMEVYQYWGNFTYKDKQLQMVMHPEGRATFKDPNSDFQTTMPKASAIIWLPMSLPQPIPSK